VNDYLVRCITTAGNIQGFACLTTHLVNQACQQHGTLPTATDALGRALTCGAMMGARLKGRDRVALKYEGSGPLKKILVEANSQGEIRGYVGVPEVNLPLKDEKPDIVSAIGKAGFLTVTKDLGLKEPYKGIVQLYSSTIATDLAYYLTESEQIPSAVGVGVFVAPDNTVAAAGGFLIQSLPPAEESIIKQVTQQIQQMPPLTEILVQGNTPEQILETIFAKIPYEILGTQPLSFRCSCSKARIEQALVSLGVEELDTLIAEGEAEVVCEFCRTPYTFTQEELEDLVKQIN
jgi:molecular chaperone Hsp33